nr:hypothetical protein [Tanacetum cinerariifolium]
MNYHPVLTENQTNSHAGFQDTEKAGDEETQTYVLFPLLSDGSTNPKNKKDAHINGKEHDDIQKSVSPDIHSSSYGDQTREQGDKAENKDKGKSPVVTGFRDLNEEFTECFNNSSNEVNAAGSSVSAAGLNFINSTNDFSAASPSNAAMPNLEDLSNNADDVGAEADINNVESIISVSPILTSRIHKDHPTSQIISDLSSTTQTRSMARGVRDQGFQDTKKAGEEGTQAYVLFPVLFDGSINPKNNNKDALVDGKEHDDDIQKSVSPNIHSSSCGNQTRKQGNKTKNKDKDDVGAEADINNLESIIFVSPIPTTRIHKDHPTSQIIGDLSLTTQTRSMERTVRDQGGISQMFNEDFHTCMFAYFLSQEEPKRVHQDLKDPNWIEAMQEELL